MKRLLLTILFASLGLSQIPSDVMRVKVAERDTPQKRFLRDNPGATEVQRHENAAHFRKADGTFAAVISPGLNYVDADNQLQPVAPELWETDAGFRQIGTPSPIRIITTSQNQDTIEIWNGSRVASATTSKLTKTGDFAWTFPWAQITWTLEVQPDGWQITSQPIASSRGSRLYQMPLGSTGLNLVPDAEGNLADGTFKITRTVMVRADGERTPCSAWTVGAKSVDFTCNDSSFPAAAYPYIIDPTATFTVSASPEGYYTNTNSILFSSPEPYCIPDDPGNPSSSYFNAYLGAGSFNIRESWLLVSIDTGCNARRTNQNVFFRFNTSTLSGMTITGATLNYYVSSWIGQLSLELTPNTESRKNVNWDWVTPSWPPVFANIQYTDWVSHADRSGTAAGPLTTKATGWNAITLGNLASINQSGFTYLRGSMNGDPAGVNTSGDDWGYGPQITGYSGATDPYLSVAYSLPGGPKMIVVQQ